MIIAATYSFLSTTFAAVRHALTRAHHGVRIDWVPVVLDEREFLDELNRRLREHPAYRPGMNFHVRPGGLAGSAESGFVHTGPDGAARVYREVLAGVSQDFELADSPQC
jgi:hypothetical protein